MRSTVVGSRVRGDFTALSVAGKVAKRQECKGCVCKGHPGVGECGEP